MIDVMLVHFTVKLLLWQIQTETIHYGAKGVELANIMCTGGTLTYDEEPTKEIFADVVMIGKDGTAVN